MTAIEKLEALLSRIPNSPGIDNALELSSVFSDYMAMLPSLGSLNEYYGEDDFRIKEALENATSARRSDSLKKKQTGFWDARTMIRDDIEALISELKTKEADD